MHSINLGLLSKVVVVVDIVGSSCSICCSINCTKNKKKNGGFSRFRVFSKVEGELAVVKVVGVVVTTLW